MVKGGGSDKHDPKVKVLLMKVNQCLCEVLFALFVPEIGWRYQSRSDGAGVLTYVCPGWLEISCIIVKPRGASGEILLHVVDDEEREKRLHVCHGF